MYTKSTTFIERDSGNDGVKLFNSVKFLKEEIIDFFMDLDINKSKRPDEISPILYNIRNKSETRHHFKKQKSEVAVSFYVSNYRNERQFAQSLNSNVPVELQNASTIILKVNLNFYRPQHAIYIKPLYYLRCRRIERHLKVF